MNIRLKLYWQIGKAFILDLCKQTQKMITTFFDQILSGTTMVFFILKTIKRLTL